MQRPQAAPGEGRGRRVLTQRQERGLRSPHAAPGDGRGRRVLTQRPGRGGAGASRRVLRVLGVLWGELGPCSATQSLDPPYVPLRPRPASPGAPCTRHRLGEVLRGHPQPLSFSRVLVLRDAHAGPQRALELTAGLASPPGVFLPPKRIANKLKPGRNEGHAGQTSARPRGVRLLCRRPWKVCSCSGPAVVSRGLGTVRRPDSKFSASLRSKWLLIRFVESELSNPGAVSQRERPSGVRSPSLFASLLAAGSERRDVKEHAPEDGEAADAVLAIPGARGEGARGGVS